MEDVIKYQKRVIEKIRILSEERLKAALDFIEYLEEKEERMTIWDLLRDKETVENKFIFWRKWEGMYKIFLHNNIARNKHRVDEGEKVVILEDIKSRGKVY